MRGAAVEDEPSRARAKPLPRQRYRPDPATSPAHQKGVASPRRPRTPAPLEFPPRTVAAAVRIWRTPGMSYLTRVAKIHAAIPVPNHLRGTLAIVHGSAHAKHGNACVHRSARQIALDCEQTRSSAIEHELTLEALDMFEIERRSTTWSGNLRSKIRPKVPARLLALIEQAAADNDVLVDEAEEEDDQGDVDEADEEDVPGLEIAPDAPASAPAAGAVEVVAPVRLELPVVARPTATPGRPQHAPAPRLPAEHVAQPGVVEGAIVELLAARSPAYASLPETPATFAERVWGMARGRRVAFVQVLIGLDECADKPGRKGVELSDFAVSCIHSVRDLRHPSALVRQLVRRAEAGETAASWTPSTSGPGPPAR